MGNSYYDVEKKVDMELRNKRKKEEIEMLEEKIRGLMEDTLKNGLTEEQMFLIKYYDLDEQEVKQKNIDISNVEQTIYSKSKIQREQLETNRYNELIDMYSTLEEFDGEKINEYNDRFHKDIRDWYDYTRDFEKDPIIVKKMRNLQMLNRMAHQYEALFKSIFYKKNPQINEDDDKNRIEYNVEEMFSVIKSDAEKATQELVKKFGIKKVSEWKNDKILKFCINASKWMFEQKETYIAEVLKDLQNTNEEYNYGVFGDSFVFDVPGYGQFSVHMGENNMKQINSLRQAYGVEDYKGDYLGNVYILSKADPELLANVNYDELSELDKQRYRIASQDIKEEPIEEKEDNSIDEVSEQMKNLSKEDAIQEEINETVGDEEKEQTETEQEEQSEDNSEYEEIREMTSDIIEKQQSIEDIEHIISKLKEIRKTLKHQIKEIEEKINDSILDSQEPTAEVIEDIKKMKEIVKQQKEKRKEVKQMIKRYKENRKIMKYTLKQEKEARNSAIDDLEL